MSWGQWLSGPRCRFIVVSHEPSPYYGMMRFIKLMSTIILCFIFSIIWCFYFVLFVFFVCVCMFLSCVFQYLSIALIAELDDLT